MGVANNNKQRPAGSGAGKTATETALSTATTSQRFTQMVIQQFSAKIGKVELTPYQQELAGHLFIGANKALTDLEAKRIKDGMDKKLPIVWNNINMEKLAIDSVYRIELGLDALIPNHLHFIPYMNNKLGKYDLSIEIGYVGKDYYKREMALVKPKDIIYQLVKKNDTFKPIMKSFKNKVESYEFDISNPFDRGEVIGGFGYIIFEDETLNKLVLVDKKAMDKSERAAKTKTFWSAHPEEMQMVVVVRRTTAALQVDPKKVNKAYEVVELDENKDEIDREANGKVLKMDDEDIDTEAMEGEYKEVTTSTKQQEEESNADMPEYLTCPITLNKRAPRKPISVCHQCEKNTECDPYMEALMNEEGGQPVEEVIEVPPEDTAGPETDADDSGPGY